LGLQGATIVTGSESYGHNRHIHSARFFQLADNPQEVVMIVTEEESKLLFDHLEKEKVQLFYVKRPVEFGMLGKPS
jgi:PII-like signaling protein